MTNVVKIRRYRTVETAGSQFITGNAIKNQVFAEKDLALSGLDFDDLEADAPAMLRLVDGATAGYVIPYFHHLTGKPIVDSAGHLAMFRTKFEYPVGIKGPKYPKYLGPNEEQLAKNGLSTCLPYVPPVIHEMKSNELICAEGEKKTASIIKLLRLPAFGIGGCQMWRDPDRSGRPHPWILELLRSRSVESITIVPDGDITRYDIAAAYGTFARALETAGFSVTILHPPGKIDDLLVAWGAKRLDNWISIPKIGSTDLVQSTRSLINEYSLAFKADAKGNPTVYQHTSNIMRLMSDHPAFPRIWLDEDNNKIMMGEEETEPNLTDMSLANYFQYNLGFHNVTDRIIHNCVLSLARANRKSPFLNYIRGIEWDGQPRLHSWLHEYWGVETSTHTAEIGIKWLVSACARLDKPGTKLDWMMILIGPQATGKTSMPFIMFKQQARIVSGDHNDKDLHLLMHSGLCAVFDELDSFGKKEASNLKAMVTTHEDAFRPPYGISTELFPRRFTLYGCGNRHEFLQHDPSGYRRYAVVEVPQLLDFKRLEADRDQLWAEAWYRYSNDKLEFWKIDNANAEAQKYVIPNLLEEKILNWLQTEEFKKQGTNLKDGYIWFNMPSILQAIGLQDVNPQNSNVTREISGILRQLGAEKTNASGNRGRGYRIKLRN